MKTTIKSVAVAIVLLTMVMVVLTAVDNAHDMTALTTNTSIKVTVVDTNNLPVHNAKIIVANQSFFCDNNGNSPTIEVANPTNSYGDFSAWFTTNVIVQKDGFVPTVVLNCVLFDKQTRKLTVKIYEDDGSNLPYVCYVETPPDEYLKTLVENK